MSNFMHTTGATPDRTPLPAPLLAPLPPYADMSKDIRAYRMETSF